MAVSTNATVHLLETAISAHVASTSTSEAACLLSLFSLVDFCRLCGLCYFLLGHRSLCRRCLFCCPVQRVVLQELKKLSRFCIWSGARTDCEREGIVGGDEGPVGGVAQVVCHGVKVVGVHGEEGQEKDGEVRGEVKGEIEELREKRSSWMVWRWDDKRVNGLEP